MLEAIKRKFLTVGRGRRRRRERPIVTGDLELFGLSEIIQFLSMGKKTALVALSRGDHQGRIWFDQGKATHAATDTAEGEAAFFETVCWNTGSFVIDYGITADRQTLHDDTLFLFMEGLRRIDESRNRLAMEQASQANEVMLGEVDLSSAVPPVQVVPLEPIELSREMQSELVETMAEIKQFVDLDAQGFVVAPVAVVPTHPGGPARPAPDPKPFAPSASPDSGLPPEVLALHRALDDR